MELDSSRISLKGFHLLEELGRGGSGWVFRVKSTTKPEEEFALKVLQPVAHFDPDFPRAKQRFRVEANRLMKHRHENLVEVYGTGNLGYAATHGTIRLPYFLMEIIPDSHEFTPWFADQESTDSEKLALLTRLSRQLLGALAFLHSRPKPPLLHLDVKSPNVMIIERSDGPLLKLMDFGAAQIVGGEWLTTQGVDAAFQSTYENTPREIKERIAHLTEQNRTLFVVPRDVMRADLDLHYFQAMVSRTLDRTVSSAGLSGVECRMVDYLQHWLRRMDWDSTPRKERFETAHEALENLTRLEGWPVRSSRLFGEGNLRLPLANLRYFGEPARAIVRDPRFQRLRGIRQLGLAHFVYPGANHARFEHSLGVFAAAIKYLRVVAGRAAPPFRSRLRNEDLKMTAAMALLHDVGHYPFSHIVDEAHIRGFSTHERLTYEVLEDGLAKTAAQAFGFDEVEFLSFARLCLSPKSGVRRRKSTERDVWPALRDVISGPIDADKFDYLRRDAHHAGVPYMGSLDPERFLGGLTVVRGEEGQFQLVVEEKAVSSAEMFAIGRYFLYTAVYFHHTVRGFDRMLQEAVYRVVPRTAKKARALASVMKSWSDEEFLDHVARECGSDVLRLGLLERRRYKRLVSIRDDPHRPWIRRAGARVVSVAAKRKIERSLRAIVRRTSGTELAESELLLDLPGDLGGESIPVWSKEGSRWSPETQFWRSINDNFNSGVRKIRIFVAAKPPNWTKEDEQELRRETRALLTES